jgi:hypothetical protein
MSKSKTVTEVGRVKVYERADGRFLVKFQDFRGEWISLTRRTRAEALQIAKAKHEELDRGKWTVTGAEAELLAVARQLPNALELLQAELKRHKARTTYTVAQLAERVAAHYSELAQRDIGRRITANDALSRMSRVSRDLGELYLDSITGEHVLDWLRQMDCSPRNRVNNLQALRNAIRLAKAWQWLPSGYDPTEPDRINAANFPHLLRVRRTDPSTWTAEEFALALEACAGAPQGAEMFLVLGGCLGLRPAEAAGVVGERDGIHWSAIDWKARTVTLDRSQVKTSRPRVMSFRPEPHSGWTPEIADAVWNRFASLALPKAPQEGSAQLALASRKSQEILRPIVRAAIGREWLKDALRHTWISALLGLGVHKEKVARLAGNSASEIDRSYEKPMDHARAAAWFAIG